MASNDEMPMEVDNDTKLPLPKHSYNSTNSEDVAELRVSLSSPEDIEPKKFKSVITKTLQSWANKNCIKGEFTATEISDDGKTAVISVTPADALKELLSLSGKELMAIKEKKTFSITPLTLDEQTQDDQKSSGEHSSLTLKKAQNSSVDLSEKDSPADDEPCLVALGPYWYMKNFYLDRIQRIEKENGVKITENVAVSIAADKKNANPKKAHEDFIRLVQSCLNESGGTSIPLKKVGSEELKETLKFLKTTDRKCQITISSDEVTILGPQNYQFALNKSLQSTKTTTDFTDQQRMGDYEKDRSKISTNFTDQERMNYFEKGGTKSSTNFTDEQRMKEFDRGSVGKQENAFDKDRKSPNRIKITTSIKDPFVSDGLPIEERYWDILVNMHVKEVDRIQDKYSVRFRDSGTSLGKKMIKVRYNKGEKNASMESHAIRALLRLYQRVAVFQLRQNNGSFDDEEEDLYRASGESNGATGKTSKYKEDKSSKGLTEEGANRKPRGAEAKKDEKKEETCPVCMDTFTQKMTLKCKHEFCEACLDQSIKSLGPTCPVCKDVFGVVEGDQPDGRMTWRTYPTPLPGFHGCGTIEITYNFPGGTQTAKHPNPGTRYHGTQRTAYLPDNKEGNEVLMLLRKAFDQKLVFTVGMSRTTGADNAITWNDIHHKTTTHGGPEGYGYPDPSYLSRVKDELKAKGIK